MLMLTHTNDSQKKRLGQGEKANKRAGNSKKIRSCQLQQRANNQMQLGTTAEEMTNRNEMEKGEGE